MPAQEAAEGVDLRWAERAGQLGPQDRPFAERFDRVQECPHLGLDTGQPALVRDDLGQLDREPEAGVGLLCPGGDGVPGGKVVLPSTVLHQPA
ncbi:hypothetical protein GCM10027436_03030 [Actinophytocola sediminis]